jgi:hypothetical protein
MSFSSLPFALEERLVDAANSIQLKSQGGAECPELLYHCTSEAGLHGIVKSTRLWATCVEDLADEGEIEHGVKMVQVELQRYSFARQASLAKRILLLLPDLLTERKTWTFVACFRGALQRQTQADAATKNERAQWDCVHPYCGEFRTLLDKKPRLRLGMGAQERYLRVVYDVDKQRGAIKELLDVTVNMIAEHCIGALDGPWGPGLAERHARIVAQALIDTVSGFKSPSFRWEDEWRIVCRPSRLAASSSPGFHDEYFRPYIRSSNGKRHVELEVKQEGPIFSGSQQRVLPFSAMHVSKFLGGSRRDLLRSVLDEYGFAEMPITTSAW